MNEALYVDVQDTKASFKRTRNPDGLDPVIGKFWFELNITAGTKDIYLPVSVASGKKPAGFVYQLEGTVPGQISKTDISCKGEGITQITLGTIVYCKIPAEMTAAFRIRIEMRGQVGKSFRAVLTHMHYKFDLRDTRYQKHIQQIHTKMLKFS